MPKRNSLLLDSRSDFSSEFFELCLYSPWQRKHCIDPLRPECLSHHLYNSLRALAYTIDARRYERAIDNLLGNGFRKLKTWIDEYRQTFEDDAIAVGYTAEGAQETYCSAQVVIEQAQDVARGLVNRKFHTEGRRGARGNELSIVAFGEILFPAMEKLRLFTERIKRKKAIVESALPVLQNQAVDEIDINDVSVMKVIIGVSNIPMHNETIGKKAEPRLSEGTVKKSTAKLIRRGFAERRTKKSGTRLTKEGLEFAANTCPKLRSLS